MDTVKESLNTVLSRLDFNKFISAVIVLVIFLVVGRLLNKLLNRGLNRTKMEATAKTVVKRIAKIVFGIITGLAVFSELGFDTSSTIAIISVFSLSLALAVNDILADVAGGFVMVSTKPFWVGDYIACEDIEGTVEIMHLNHTKLRTIDGVLITVPNRIIASSKVKNYSVYGRRRLAISAYTSYDDPPEKTIQVLMDLIKSYDTILEDPAPGVYLTAYQDSNLEYTMYFWVKPKDLLNTKRDITQKIIQVFRENNITISYNHLNIHVMEPENVIRINRANGKPAAEDTEEMKPAAEDTEEMKPAAEEPDNIQQI